jgi:hypothetical protein
MSICGEYNFKLKLTLQAEPSRQPLMAKFYH